MYKEVLKVILVNISEKKGTIKKPVKEIILYNNGIKSDAHAGNWHRQVSLLAKKSIDRFTISSGKNINYGEFDENITTSGIELCQTSPKDKLIIGSVEL